MAIRQKIKEHYNFDVNSTVDKVFNIFKESIIEKCPELSLCRKTYRTEWVEILRGNMMRWNGRRMIRIIGNPHKDKIIYGVIYVPFEDIYIPITVFKETEFDKKIKLYAQVLRYKRLNN